MSQSLKEILHFIKTQPIRISVFGTFGTGKTTFLNGLIGEAILTVAIDPTTAVPTYIRYARKFNILVYLQDGNKLWLFEDDPPFWASFVGRQSVLNTLKKQEGEIREFLKEWTKEGEKAKEVVKVTIELPLPWLEHNIELVDTPGMESEFTKHQNYTKSVAKETDIAIFMFDARQGNIKKTELVGMVNPFQKVVSQSLVVLNKMDRLDKGDNYDEDEREDILTTIRDEILPKHWKGVIQPQVFGISSLIQFDTELANNEPELLDEFERLISFLKTIAVEERSKILLNRLGNPEKKLFKQATQFESEKKYGKAHNIYFDLQDILEAAKMDISPAKDGIQRCEKVLNAQVTELDKINKDTNDAFALEKKEPDKVIKELQKAQKRLKEINAPDEDVDKGVKRIAKRIGIRNKARKAIDGIKESSLTEENKGNLILAVEIIKGFHEHTDLAELDKKIHERLVDLEKELIKNRDNQCLEKWESIQQKADIYFEKHQYNKARSVVPDIEKIQPFLSNKLQKQAKYLLNTIKTQYNQWEDFKKLFRTLRTNILQQFENTAVNSKYIINILPDLKVLKDHCLHFFPKTNKMSKLTLHKDTILTINDKVNFVKYFLNYKGNFDGKTLEKLKETLLERKEELSAIPGDPKAWFDNPSYFEKYPDHPGFIPNITNRNYKVTFFTPPWKLKKIKVLIKRNKKYLEGPNKYVINDVTRQYDKYYKRQNKVYTWSGMTLIIIFITLFGIGQNFLKHQLMFNQFEAYCKVNSTNEIIEWLPKINTLYHGLWYDDETKELLEKSTILSPIMKFIQQSKEHRTNLYLQAELLSTIAYKQAEAGMYEAAISTAKQIKNNVLRSSALVIIAEKQVKSGDTTGAKTTFEAAISAAKPDRYFGSEVIATIAEKQVKIGDTTGAKITFEAAISTANQIKNNDFRYNVLATIAEKQAEAGMYEAAISTAKQIRNNVLRSRALVTIAEKQAEAGMFNAAISTANQINNNDGRSKALVTIAYEQASNNSIKEEISTAKQIRNEFRRYEALATIAEKQAKSGDTAGAKTTFEAAIYRAMKIFYRRRDSSGRRVRSNTLTTIAEKQTEAGMFNAAVSTAKQIRNNVLRSSTLVTIAEKQVKSGDTTGAKITFEAAIFAAKRLRYSSSKVIATIAEKQAKAGMFNAAVSAVNQIEDWKYRSNVLATIAGKQAEAGMYEAAISTAKKIRNNVLRSSALVTIAEKQVKSGDTTGAKITFEAAISAAKPDRYSSSEVIATIAEKQAKAGMFNAAVSAVNQIEDWKYRSNVLATIAEKQAEAGMYEAAISTAKNIWDKELRERTLKLIKERRY